MDHSQSQYPLSQLSRFIRSTDSNDVVTFFHIFADVEFAIFEFGALGEAVNVIWDLAYGSITCDFIVVGSSNGKLGANIDLEAIRAVASHAGEGREKEKC